MNELKVGFSRCDITPPLGVYMPGYYAPRYAKGVLDPIRSSAVALSDGETTAAIISIDATSIVQAGCDKICAQIAKIAGIDKDAVYFCATHTHTSTMFVGPKADASYVSFATRKIGDNIKAAIADMTRAQISINRGSVPGLSFVRRYRMKDGTVQTNPPMGSPEIDHPIGEPDDSVRIVKFTRDGKDDIVLVNYQTHADTIGGEYFSADWPGVTCRSVEGALGNTKCIVLNGAEGDTNQVNAFLPAGSLRKGYAVAQNIGRSVAGEVLKLYTMTEPVGFDKLVCKVKKIKVKANKATPEELEKALVIADAYERGDKEFFKPMHFKGMEYTVFVAEATRMKSLANAPEELEINLSAMKIGDVVLCGIAGEPFTDIGRQVMAYSPFKMTFYTCLTNGANGYFPTENAYAEGGYESRSSPFKAGVADTIIAESKAVIDEFAKA